MPSPRIISVNVGAIRDRDRELGGRSYQTAIDKRAVAGRVFAGTLGLTGDAQADKVNHGGADQALYVYSREDLDWWTEQNGEEYTNGAFGENLTVAGLDVNGALIGEIWRLGPSVVAQVTSPRIPCQVFAGWTKQPHWVKRFAAARRPGPYLRVLTEGHVGAGDPIEVLSRPDVHVTVAESMDAYYGDPDIMRALLTVDGRGGKWDSIGANVLGRVRV
jgi:MOSC domain-containing protein YiiM